MVIVTDKKEEFSTCCFTNINYELNQLTRRQCHGKVTTGTFELHPNPKSLKRRLSDRQKHYQEGSTLLIKVKFSNVA
ncbi:hypothetical protein NQ317_012817 [Molorchus minor]|uniref:Uncharacterized protein n=1 Tax=Molorchus minor TaxID=1323400 RepID=A0ABQ9K3I2_9CUCU|nr:hypothetical protein NQ317_012817 [Molorchus minor]